MKLRYSILTLIATVGVTCAYAQEHPAAALVQELDDAKVDILFSDQKGDQNVYELFLENAPNDFHAPKVPRFAIRGKDGKFLMGIGTMIKAVGVFDWGNPISSADCFTTSAITKAAPGEGSSLRGTFNQTTLYLNFLALPGNENQIGGYVNAYFTGPNNAFNLQYAYIRYRGIQIGHYQSLFSDMAACPPTIDQEGPNAYTGVDINGVTYTHKVGDGLKLGIGLELPELMSSTYNSTCKYVSQRVPAVPAYVQYTSKNGSYARLSGLVRNLQYRDLIEDKNRDCVGWGINLSGIVNFTPSFMAYYQGAYGKGMTSYIQDLTGMGLDLTPREGKPGRMDAVEAWAAYGGLQYTFSPKVFASATYSHVRDYAKAYEGGATPFGSQYKYAQYVVGNVFYNVTSYFQTGVEYIWGRRVNMDGTSLHDNRINLMAQLTF